MKTTVEINDELLIEAKKAAIEEHKTLRNLIEDGLRLRLHQHYTRKKPSIKWVVAEGGVPPETSDREAMHQWMEDNK